MTASTWADTPADTDYIAAAHLDHQDQQADEADHACVDGDCDNQWAADLAAAYRAVGALGRTA